MSWNKGNNRRMYLWQKTINDGSGFRTARTEVTTYKLYINIVTTEKFCFRTGQNKFHKRSKDNPPT